MGERDPGREPLPRKLRYVSWPSGKGVWLPSFLSWSVYNSEVILAEEFLQSSLSFAQLLCRHEGDQVFMVGEDLDRSWASSRVSLPFFELLDNG